MADEFLREYPGEIQVKEFFGLRIQANLGVWRTSNWTGVALLVYFDAERLRGAYLWCDGKGHGNRIVEGRCPLSPLVIEQGQRVRQRGALAEN